ncbi:MAG: carbohydrate-binding family 9-like protein [Bacteroidales bacterium]|nr:carbohydrate-binding family 9-like protein [Bacteroidales bacterium]
MEVLETLPLEECAILIDTECPVAHIENVNWPEVAAYAPRCTVKGAYTSKHIFIHFAVEDEEDIRAVNSTNLSPVADDSCVEFFLSVPGSKEYWNFEFNCIGAVNASHRETRPNAIRLTDAEIASIKRHASLGTEPFGEKEGTHRWTLTVAIPFSLIGYNPMVGIPFIMGNFYKCAGKSKHPHYLSWKPIKAEKPNFHLPEFFGTIILD